LALEELLAELTVRLAEMLGARAVEAQVGEELVLRTAGALARRAEPGEPPPAGGVWEEVPLQIEGTRIGAVRVAPAGPDSLEHEELSFLREAADRAALSIRRAQLHEEEHRIAVELQRGLIPRQLAAVTGLSLAAHYEAAGVGAEVGGDWYDAFELPGGRLGVVLGDVAGSGIRAASTMGQLRSVTRAFALAEGGRRQPGEVMELLNGYRVALEELGLFTVVYAIIDPAEGRFEWSNAGHPPPLHMSDGDAHFLDAGDGLMGLEDAEYRTLSVPISSGDALVLYSDGLIERRSESLDAGMARLATAALSGPPGAEELCQHLLARLLPVEGGLNDDVTAVVVKVM
jgi:serine phosphatase RsbU (regulator of sigma subunit)